MNIELDEYEVTNLRSALLFLKKVGGDTGDWYNQVLFKLPETKMAPNKSPMEQFNQLALYVGWRALSNG